nr:DNA-directed DNA polymerase [Tanacetum cinerariifolium]
MVTKLRNEITKFEQKPHKSLFEACEHYKLSIDRCPNHNMLLVTQTDTFYNGLALSHRDTINVAARGTFMQKTPEECYELIENMTAHHNHWDTKVIRDETSRNISSTSTTESPEVVRQLEMMNKNFFRDDETITNGSRPFPSNTIANPRGDLKTITTRSGVSYDGPPIPPLFSSLPKVVERVPEVTKDTLSLPELTPTRMILELADRSTTRPAGIAEDVFVKVGKFHFLIDFVVVGYVVDPRVPSLLRGPFLRTGRALIDVYGSDFILEEIETFLRTLDELSNLDDGYYDMEGDILYLEKLLNEDPSLNLPLVKTEDLKQFDAPMTKPLIEEPPELELKELSSCLEYAFLKGTNKLPVIISKELKNEEKSAYLKVLKSRKRAIAWKIFDIKGIDPRFCTHKVLMEDDFKPMVQHQRRVNSKINEVIKKEVIKLLNAGLIYPISDSPWILIDPQDQEKTTFTCPYGTFAYRRIPFSLCNAPGTFQRCMMAIFYDMIEETMEVYTDDFSVFEDSFSSCLSHLDKMLKRIEIGRAKVDVIAKLPHPTSVKVYTDHSALKYLLAKQDAKPIFLWWILLLQEFDVIIRDKKGAENLVADHLSRLENPHQDELEKKEITDTFPLETLGMIAFRSDSSTPWNGYCKNHEKRAKNRAITDTRTERALVNAYEADKIILDSYGETVILKRRHDDDDDQDEGPSARSDQGSKRRREGKEPESASALLETATRSAGRSTTGSKSRQVSASESAFAEEPVQTISQMDEPSYPVVDTLTLELLAGPTFELLKGSYTSLIELEYHLEKVYKATTDQLDWDNPKGQQYLHNLLQPLPLIPDNRGRH